MSADALILIRHEWEDGSRRLEAGRDDRRRYDRLVEQVEIVSDELRKRVGQTYTLEQLAVAYADADRWARQALAERAPAPGWARDLVLIVDAAFYGYQRGAVDYLS
jgi:hypothetical protein